MADEITISGSLAYDDGDFEISALEVSSLLVSVTTEVAFRNKQQIGTSEEALILGDVSSLGWAIFKNLDATNFIELRVSTGSTKFAKLKAGEIALFRFGSGITAPYAIADTAACWLAYILCST